jgi:hypothetical protein
MTAIQRRLGLLLVVAITASASGWSTPAQRAGTEQDSACPVYLARPDLRDCFVFPDCGGYFIYRYDTAVENLCTADLPFAGHVTRLVYVDDDGTITPFDVPCDQPLTGSIQPDPDYPNFNMFVALACVG